MHWKKDIEANRWVFERFADQFSRRAIAILNPHAIALRDYLVELKIPIPWISGAENTGAYPKASPVMRWPANIPCLGWPAEREPIPNGTGELLGLELFSECAKFMVCSADDGFPPTCSSPSVHSGTSATFRQVIPSEKLQRDKIYVCFIGTYGDGRNFQRHYYRKLADDAWQCGRRLANRTAGLRLPTRHRGLLLQQGVLRTDAVNGLSGLCYVSEDNYAESFPPRQREQM